MHATRNTIYWVGQKVHSVLDSLMGKTEQTFWPTQIKLIKAKNKRERREEKEEKRLKIPK